ncbi:hypothetical protein HUW51_09265 [Adhaeribacter swui]|uniref:Uncharacterized protein n=1 Tax=Adhaeribacter swui TaxID=2086471 RepID=A0A7G7G2N3_9BACT|nr:hypothetical protein HUW51_09265 [Adhaeribacter swui]
MAESCPRTHPFIGLTKLSEKQLTSIPGAKQEVVVSKIYYHVIIPDMKSKIVFSFLLPLR